LHKKKVLDRPRLLLFGGSGSIGRAVNKKFQAEGWETIVVSRGTLGDQVGIQWDPTAHDEAETILNSKQAIEKLKQLGPFDAVCWAQGINCSDSIYDFDVTNHERVYRANVLYILSSLQTLLIEGVLRKPARLCVLSSIWQKIARRSKLSYSISKSSLQGLVLSVAADLANEGHVINAVLPGVIDTPMTRKNLTDEQILSIEKTSLFGRLATIEEVSNVVYDLCKSPAIGITGQFISVDLGYSNVRDI
jgi:3-oxoacyl-[acyl-carrier protein] reductase